jgi:peptide/nickel transport system ATP-binding protein
MTNSPTGASPLLQVRDLQVHFPIRSGVLFDRQVGTVRAVDGVNMTVGRGATYGLVGESGCGKSTLGRGLLRLVEPTAGTITFDGISVRELAGEDLRRLRRRMQMIFQDPMASLDPRQSVESILTEPLSAHGTTSKNEQRGRVRELLDVVGLPTNAGGRYPHEFSGGQRQRIGIARAIALNPELIVADEPVSALDVSIQAQVVNLLEDLQGELGLTYIVIAHDLAVVRHISQTIGVMYLGTIVEETSSDELYARPLHPYTIALMSAVPIPDPVIEERRQRILLHGDLPSPAAPPAGCRFHTRCPYRQPTRCTDERPPLRPVELDGAGAEHLVACHYAEDILAGRIKPSASAFSATAAEGEVVDPALRPPLEVDAAFLTPESLHKSDQP